MNPKENGPAESHPRRAVKVFPAPTVTVEERNES